MAEVVIQKAVGVASRRNSRLGPRIQLAMQAALVQANAEGISNDEANSPILRERMMEARQRVLDADAAERAAKE